MTRRNVSLSLTLSKCCACELIAISHCWVLWRRKLDGDIQIWYRNLRHKEKLRNRPSMLRRKLKSPSKARRLLPQIYLQLLLFSLQWVTKFHLALTKLLSHCEDFIRKLSWVTGVVASSAVVSREITHNEILKT